MATENNDKKSVPNDGISFQDLIKSWGHSLDYSFFENPVYRYSVDEIIYYKYYTVVKIILYIS